MQDNHFPQQFPVRERDSSHPLVNLDRDRCINCEICVRASRVLDGKHVFATHGRGIHSRLAVDSPTGRLKDSEVAPDDMAVKFCPTGALTVKRVGFQAPIGQRTFDKESIAAVELREFACREAIHG
jgi:[NiFe] hydrogenase diaphorase moiety small subunit